MAQETKLITPAQALDTALHILEAIDVPMRQYETVARPISIAMSLIRASLQAIQLPPEENKPEAEQKESK